MNMVIFWTAIRRPFVLIQESRCFGEAKDATEIQLSQKGPKYRTLFRRREEGVGVLELIVEGEGRGRLDFSNSLEKSSQEIRKTRIRAKMASFRVAQS